VPGSDAVKAPTLLVGIEGFGEAVIERLQAEVRPLGDVPVRTCLVRKHEELPHLRDRLYALVDELVRTRLGRIGVSRLDVAVIADLVEPGSADRAAKVVEVLYDVFAQFAEALPMSRSVDQRAITLVAILGAPPLLETSDLVDVHNLEQWHQTQGLRALSRIFLISRQHEGGTLTDDDLERGAFLLAASAYLSGLRDDDRIANRLAHRNDAELVSLANAAAADVPVESVISYCAWRTALAGLDTLSDRCATPAGAGVGDFARTELDHERWIAPLRDGDAARKARTWDSGSLSPVAPGVPDAFGWTVPAKTIEAGVAPLVRFARGMDGDLSPRRRNEVDEATLIALDRAERVQLEMATARLDGFVLGELGAEHGLERLPRTAAALDAVEQWLSDQAKKPLVRPRPDAPAQPTDGPKDEIAALDRVLVERPSAAGLVLKALALGFVAAVLVTGLVLTIQAAPSAPAAAAPAPGGVSAGVVINSSAGGGTTATPWAVIVPVVLSFLLVALGWLSARAVAMGRRLAAAIDSLRTAATAGRRERAPGGAGSEAALSLRERRLARTLLQRVIAARQRVAGLRSSVSEARERGRQELRRLGYVAADGTRPDNAAGVLGPESPLHRHLIGPDGLDLLWRSTRHTPEEEHWARELLTAAWPKAGLTADLPFDDEATWRGGSCVAQHARLQQSSALAWAPVKTEVAANLRDFLDKAVDPSVVGLGVAPTDKHFQPLPSNAQAGFVVVAPTAARATLKGIGTVRHPFEEAVATTPVSRVVVLRTHPGCSAKHLAWGIEARKRR
jgi:hypothetical protein